MSANVVARIWCFIEQKKAGRPKPSPLAKYSARGKLNIQLAVVDPTASKPLAIGTTVMQEKGNAAVNSGE